jgi:hypothetical protein
MGITHVLTFMSTIGRDSYVVAASTHRAHVGIASKELTTVSARQASCEPWLSSLFTVYLLVLRLYSRSTPVSGRYSPRKCRVRPRLTRVWRVSCVSTETEQTHSTLDTRVETTFVGVHTAYVSS